MMQKPARPQAEKASVFRRPLQLQNLLGIDSPPSQLGMVGDLRLAVICSPCADERIAHGF
jgi:hypothetical protein